MYNFCNKVCSVKQTFFIKQELFFSFYKILTVTVNDC